jgi:hypothetical protein
MYKNKTLFNISIGISITSTTFLNTFTYIISNFNTIPLTIFSLIAILYIIYELIFIKIDK